MPRKHPGGDKKNHLKNTPPNGSHQKMAGLIKGLVHHHPLFRRVALAIEYPKISLEKISRPTDQISHLQAQSELPSIGSSLETQKKKHEKKT